MEFSTLGELSVNGKGSYGIAASAVPYSKDLYTYLRITDITDDGRINFNGLTSVDDVNAEKYKLKPNDIVFARTGGSTGRNYFYDGHDGEFVYAGFLIKFSIDSQKVNPKFIKYYCQSREYKDWVRSFNTGSTRGNINAQTYAGMPIPMLSRKQQDGIVSILEAIDEKIEENNHINENLEQQALALFRHYFITFEPYRRSAPSNWSKVSLDDVCTRITDGSHYSPSDVPGAPYPMYSVKNMETYGFDSTSCKHITAEDFHKMQKNDCVPKLNDILVAKDGSYLKEIFICSEEKDEAILSSIAIFRPNTKVIIPEILLYLLKQPSVRKDVGDNFVSGSALPRIVLKDFKKYTFLLPPMTEQLKIGAVLHTIRMQTKANVDEIQNLSALRDTLLPQLMSGEIDVSDLTI